MRSCRRSEVLWLVPAICLMAGCSDRNAEPRSQRAAPQARLAEEAFGRGEYARAFTFAEFAAQYDPLNPAHRDLLLRCELAALMAGDQSLSAERLARLDAISDALEPADPAHSWLYATARGFSAFARGDAAAARTHFDEGVKKNAKFAIAHIGLGHLLLSTGKLDESLASFQAAVAINPSHAGALANVGRLLIEKGRAPEAMDPLNRSLALRDSNATRANLAEAMAASGMRPDAITQLRRVLQGDPRNAAATLRLANLLLEDGQAAEAMRAFRLAQELGAPAAGLGLAQGQIAQQDYAAAYASLREVLKQAPADLNATFLAGEVAEKLQKPAEANMLYSNYLKLAAAVPTEVARVAIVQDRVSRLPAEKAPGR